VLIVDVDAHSGGGTYSLVGDMAEVHHLDISVSTFDSYPPDDLFSATLDLMRDAREYVPLLRRRLLELDTTRFDLCLYNAGMDPFEDCGTGGLAGISVDVLREREVTLFEWARGRGLPVVFVLAGGYVGSALNRDGLLDLHRLTIDAARNR
jgi:acetoin utilization deacetylase AcuC-like enzyme